MDPYPHLSLAAVYDALSYYYDHEDEIEIEPSIPDLGQVDERLGFSIDTPAPPCTFGDHGR